LFIRGEYDDIGYPTGLGNGNGGGGNGVGEGAGVGTSPNDDALPSSCTDDGRSNSDDSEDVAPPPSDEVL